MRKAGDVLYIVMPAYNEEGAIADVVRDWIKLLDGKSEYSRLVIADSGSSDKTHTILMELQKKFKKLKVLSNTEKPHGPKVIALYKYAIENQADYIFQTDSDGQTNPNEFNAFWDNRHNHDAILGCRKKRGDGRVRALVEKIVCLLLRIFFKVRVPDANAPFRLMDSDLLKKYINKFPSNYDLPNIILTAYFVKFNHNVIFKEITFRPRTTGNNSIDLKKIFRIGKESLGAFNKFKKNMIKEHPEIKKAERRHKLWTIATILAFSIASFMIISNSNSFPWKKGETLTDSSVFLTIGEQMKAGSVPYKDTFDHKGPLLYFINYWGVLISESKGIFLFEFLAIFITMWFMYKIARLKIKSQPISAILTMIAFTPFLAIYAKDCGNLTEQYAMPFIASSIYIFLRYFSKEKVSNFSIFAVGASFMCILMLRANMVGVLGVFCLAIFIKNIVKKEFKELGKNICLFTFGALIILIPILYYFISNGALEDFINTYIKFNLAYSKTDTLLPVISVMISFISSLIILLSFMISIYYAIRGSNQKERTIFKIYLVALFVLLLSACISGRPYQHYGMILPPATIFPLAVFYQKLKQSSTDNSIGLILILFLTVLTANTWLDMTKNSIDTYQTYLDNKQTLYVAMDELCGYIDTTTHPSDKIAVYGSWNYAYLRCNRLPISKYSYQSPISDIKPEILDEFYDEISLKRPKIFIVAKPDNNVFTFLNNNGYKEKLLQNNASFRVFYTNQ
ncbi:glycosyltransferase [Candidatus Saccharibacteria bacterium]|nr:glycosyltransferase [Candidatus Saccharibacteria bacterium]